MSNAQLEVRFADGLILYGQYHGTSDICHPNLFDTAEEAWSHERHDPAGRAALNGDRVPIAPEPVEIYTEYGRYWGGRACRRAKVLVDNLAGFEDDELFPITWPRDRLFEEDWARKKPEPETATP